MVHGFYPKYIPFCFPSLDKIFCIFTTNLMGDILKEDTKGILKREFSWRGIFEVNQEHKDKMIFFDSPAIPYELTADALATSLWGYPLLIKIADCQPLLIAHVSQQYIAAFHVGWRANRGGYIMKWVELFCDHYGVKPKDLFAVRGPSLSFHASEFKNFFTEWSEEYLVYYDATSKNVNLWEITKDQLVKSGLKEQNIFYLSF